MAARDDRDPLDLAAIEPVLGYVLRRAQLLEAQRFAVTVGRTGVRPVQFTLLSLIRDNPGVRPADLASALDIRRANMVALLQELESRGWVARRRHPDDGRAQVLHLEKAGQRFLQRVDKRHQAYQAELAERMGDAPLKDLVSLLQRFIAS
jgi:DNA-binding MarR family transcriptional regulator